MSTTATVQLNTGASMPVLFLGTWKSQPGKVEYAVEYALKTAGYRGIDTATDYENEKEVGQGLAASGVPREDIFLTTKLDNRDHGRIEQALRDSLSSLNTPYIDLWLMHWPAPMLKEGGPDKSIDWLDTWKEMERIFKSNPDKLKAIGISNFSVPYLERLLEVAKIVPAVNQIELHPACRQQEIRDFCLQKGIVISAYSPLGSDDSPLLNHPVVSQLAEKHSVTPATVLISLQANIPNTTVLPKSVNKERIDSNSRFIRLTEEEIASLLSIGETLNFRACNPEWAGWGHLGFPDRIKAVQTEAKV
ncbi:hypothetical protein FRB91_002577 [Serendipita sp. 411]|nr:hypothetical protein FRC19_008221 [Serendipita sp. 401]KAG8855192.1 hypothetical protein FRB91_002577 [Serendipita sp. 411]KAG9053862.1 hypothetical protein FS842_006924 [Serendipita sp. 407]